MPEYYKIERPFKGPGSILLRPGDIVDAAGWRNKVALAGQGKMSPCSPPEKTAREKVDKPSNAR